MCQVGHNISVSLAALSPNCRSIGWYPFSARHDPISHVDIAMHRMANCGTLVPDTRKTWRRAMNKMDEAILTICGDITREQAYPAYLSWADVLPRAVALGSTAELLRESLRLLE